MKEITMYRTTENGLRIAEYVNVYESVDEEIAQAKEWIEFNRKLAKETEEKIEEVKNNTTMYKGAKTRKLNRLVDDLKHYIHSAEFTEQELEVLIKKA